ncbi:MAG: 50S ribosomal protein L25/general stress protein Ctc [Alphaproteobacteria bacterium]|nr:50S ribosomal protein L25/general stress protein Ctc [Alphaproteobacteria bacterium]
MYKNYAFSATKRQRAGKGVARALRREGNIPAVIYGDSREPIGISLSSNAINVEYLKGHMFTSLCDLNLEGEKHLVLARDIQLHPVTDVVIHADFLRVTPKTSIAVEVPVHFVNQEKSSGLREGGVLNIVLHEIQLMCSAMNIPEAIDVDLEGKKIGDTIHLSDTTLPKGVKSIVTDRDIVIATIAASKKVDEAEAAEAAAAAAASAASTAEAGASAAAKKGS